MNLRLLLLCFSSFCRNIIIRFIIFHFSISIVWFRDQLASQSDITDIFFYVYGSFWRGSVSSFSYIIQIYVVIPEGLKGVPSLFRSIEFPFYYLEILIYANLYILFASDFSLDARVISFGFRSPQFIISWTLFVSVPEVKFKMNDTGWPMVKTY